MKLSASFLLVERTPPINRMRTLEIGLSGLGFREFVADGCAHFRSEFFLGLFPFILVSGPFGEVHEAEQFFLAPTNPSD